MTKVISAKLIDFKTGEVYSAEIIIASNEIRIRFPNRDADHDAEYVYVEVDAGKVKYGLLVDHDGEYENFDKEWNGVFPDGKESS